MPRKIKIEPIEAKVKKEHSLEYLALLPQSLVKIVPLNIKKENKTFKCNVCGLKFATKKDLINHSVAHQDKKYQCEKCHNKFLLEEGLQYHDCRYCKFCDRLFDSNFFFRPHMTKKHGVKFSNYVCDHCGDEFRIKLFLVQHMRNVHIKEKGFPCDICNKVMKQKGSLTRHKMTHEKIKQNCKNCGHKFNNKVQR
jgi:Zn finger protein HypA/HybF involved in hydrogenase expression